MRKRADAFRSIGEVAKLIGVAPHVLRYWETQFTQLKPMKRPDGRRYYRHEDVLLAAGLCEVLREEGLTIRGARKLIAKDRGDLVRARGRERIGGLLGFELDDQPESPADNPAQQPVEAVAMVASPLAQQEAEDQRRPDDAPVSAEETTTMAQTPRPRQRKPRHAASADGLPLFPDLDRRSAEACWLANLAALTDRMRSVHSLNARSRDCALHLRDAIARYY